MKKIAIFLMIAVLCLTVIATSCTRNGKDEKTEPKETKVTEKTPEEGVESPSEGENSSNDEQTEVPTEEITTEETEGYEPMTDGDGIEMPEVPV